MLQQMCNLLAIFPNGLQIRWSERFPERTFSGANVFRSERFSFIPNLPCRQSLQLQHLITIFNGGSFVCSFLEKSGNRWIVHQVEKQMTPGDVFKWYFRTALDFWVCAERSGIDDDRMFIQ